MATFFVLSPLGPHMPGEVIEIAEEHTENGVDVERLLDLGAMRPASDSEVEAADVSLLGSGDPDRIIAAIPPVPAVKKGK